MLMLEMEFPLVQRKALPEHWASRIPKGRVSQQNQMHILNRK